MDFFTSPEDNVTKENILSPDEVVTRIILAKVSQRRHSAYVEVREKESFDWALVAATVSLKKDGNRVKEARVVLGAVAPKPMRRKDLERMLVGQTVDDAILDRVTKPQDLVFFIGE